jgi:2-methylcitrate dehydratase PrpD
MMSASTVSRTLAEFSCNLRLEDIQPATLKTIKNHLLDCVGVGLAGSREEPACICYETIAPSGGREEATVLGRKKKLPAKDAALINGTAVHSIELDDGRVGSGVHAGASVLPTVLALCEREGKGGKDFILAALIGYEVTLRVAMAMFPHHRRMGLHPTGTVGGFGAAAAAGKVLNLSVPQIINAFGLAGTFASGLREGKGDALMMKRLHAGRAAQNGILAASLAKNNYQAPETIFEGDNGFFRLFSKGFDPLKITEGLGNNFVTDQSYYKPYSCCRHLHAPIDSLLGILKKHKVAPEQVEQISVRIYKEGTYYQDTEPQNILDAQFSMPYTLAVVFYEKQALLEQYTDEKIRRSDLRALAKKVKVEFDPALDEEYVKKKKMAHVLEIQCQDGRRLTNRVDYPKGSLENPFTQEEIVGKFKNLSALAIGQEKAGKVLSLWENLENLEKMEKLGELLQP